MEIFRTAILFTITIIFMFTGCSLTRPAKNISELKQKIGVIELSNGITEQEAVYIAQNYLLENPPENNPTKMDIDIYKLLYAHESEGLYSFHFDFVFENGKPFLYPCYWSVKVHKKTADILRSRFGCHK